jgi:hypothetical protein
MTIGAEILASEFRGGGIGRWAGWSGSDFEREKGQNGPPPSIQRSYSALR